MQNKIYKYIILVILLILLIPINYFIFGGNPNDSIQNTEEEVIKDVTGVQIDLNPK